MDWLLNLVRDPKRMWAGCSIYILSYYFLSIFSMRAVRTDNTKSWWRKNGFLDISTSVTCILFAIVLIWSLGTVAFSVTLTLQDLIWYYFFFVFLFAFCYGILDWHWPGMLEGVARDSWNALIEHVLISIQTQTTIGYTRGKPKRLGIEVIAAIQALLGIFLTAISIARAVNNLTR